MGGLVKVVIYIYIYTIRYFINWFQKLTPKGKKRLYIFIGIYLMIVPISRLICLLNLDFLMDLLSFIDFCYL